METNQINLAKTLKRVCPTQWNVRIQVLEAPSSCFFFVIRILTYLLLHGKTMKSNVKLKTWSNFEQFSTIILIILESKILEPINTVSKMLQGAHEDIDKPVEMLSLLLTQFQNLKNKWEFVKNDALELSGIGILNLRFQKKDWVVWKNSLMNYKKMNVLKTVNDVSKLRCFIKLFI